VIGSVAVGYYLRPQAIPSNTQGVETQASLAVTETTQSALEGAPRESKASKETKAPSVPEQAGSAVGVSTTADDAIADRKESQGTLDKQPVAVAVKAVVPQAAAVEPNQVKPFMMPPPSESAVVSKDKAIVPTPYAEAKQDSKGRVERLAAAQSLPPTPSPQTITPPSTPAAVKKPASATVDTVKPAKEAPPPTAAKTAPKPRPKAVKPTVQTARSAVRSQRDVPKAAKTSAYFVQLVSVKSQNAADRECDRLSKRFTKLLSGLESSIQKASVAGKGTFYRLRAAGFNTQGQARDLCRKLKAAKQSCLVVRR
jgi:hypothetical protein